jgi:glycerol-1-phosphate dehydrogenase [NAD(P)+]
MDGFASVVSPITVNGFKHSLEGKCPEVIVADTAVMARAPKALKSAGLGDLLGKYTAHADWEIAHITTGEYYCEKIASLTRKAVDSAVNLAQSGDDGSPAYAGALMEALVLSGIAMKLAGCTRPASGAEHHLSHFWEAKYLQLGLPPVFHGTKVGIATAIVADIYGGLAGLESVREVRKPLDEDELKGVFGSLWPEMRGENFPNPLDRVPKGLVPERWGEIRAVLGRLPSAEKIRELLRKTGGPATCAEAGISPEVEAQGKRYGKYVRFRITLMRILDMIEW